MTSDYDLLKRTAIKTLESKGVLGNAKAQLRATVYSAIIEQERAGEVANARVALKTEEEKLACAAIRQWLRSHGMHYTLSVMDAELQAGGGGTQGGVSQEDSSSSSSQSVVVVSLDEAMRAALNKQPRGEKPDDDL